jgi:hypothetical protein
MCEKGLLAFAPGPIRQELMMELFIVVNGVCCHCDRTFV